MSDISSVADQVQYLQDLFQRKLLEDRAKNQLIESLRESLERRDAMATGEAFRDLFKEALVALDRLQSEEPDKELSESVADELLEVFVRRGLQLVPVEGQVDPKFHEVVEVAPANEGQATGEILSVERDGYLLGGRLLRPARVVIAGVVANDS